MIDRLLLAVMLCALFGGCVSVGPETIQRDRIDYGSAMSEALKQQTVLNIVKSRYVDWPTFIDVSQVVASYSLAGSASLGWIWFPRATSSSYWDTSVSGTYTESPTITYAPLAGKDFAQALLEPLSPDAILAVAYTGWRVDRLFELTLNSINGKRNARFVGDTLNVADDGFLRALDLFRDLQAAGAWRLRRKAEKEGKKQTGDSKQSQGEEKKAAGSQDEQLSLFFQAPDDAPEIGEKITELKTLLGLDPKADAYRVTYGDRRGADDVLALESRTLWEVFWDLQRFVEVPPGDEAAGRTIRGLSADRDREPILRIRSASTSSAPKGAFVAVPYRENWFWIDDDDLGSKHSLSIILMMTTLARPDSAEAPQLVIPTR